MGKRWIFALTVALALGLIGLLAYTSESVHRVAAAAADRCRGGAAGRRAGPRRA